MSGLVTIGEVMLAVRPEEIGPLRAVHRARLSVAGSEATVAIGVRRLGHAASWISKLPDDATGACIRASMEGEGVDVHAVHVEGTAGVLIQERRTATTRAAYYARAKSTASTLGPADVPEGLVEAADIVHVTGITAALSESAADCIAEVVARADTAGVPVSLDVNHRRRLWSDARARATLEPLARSASMIHAGIDEARLILGGDVAHGDDPSELATALRRLGAETAIVTDGAAGSWLSSPGVDGHVPAITAREIDPFGAGDAFVAGIISARLDGATWLESVELGTRVAAIAVATDGDWEGLPNRRDLVAAPSILR